MQGKAKAETKSIVKAEPGLNRSKCRNEFFYLDAPLFDLIHSLDGFEANLKMSIPWKSTIL